MGERDEVPDGPENSQKLSVTDRFFGRTSIVHLVSSYFHGGPRHKPALSTDEFRRCGYDMVNYIADYHLHIEKRRVVPDVDPGYLAKLLPTEAPYEPESFASIMADVERCIMPGITHWQHPRFHAYFPSGNSYPSILADMLSDAIGCIGFSWAASPACTELETIMLDWFGKMVGLPDKFTSSKTGGKGGGVIMTSASESVLVALLAARHGKIQGLKQKDQSIEEGQILSKLVAYCSKEAHSCVEKAAMLGFVKLRTLETDERYCLRGETLAQAISEDTESGLIPFFAVATLGTTSCCSFDNLQEIGPICSKQGIWLHVDAAYAGSAFICHEFRRFLSGVEHATSFITNPNKFLLTNFDTTCMWVQDALKLTKALVVDPLYLQHHMQGTAIDYRHWHIPLSRRFRSLKLWFVIRMYGIKGLQSYIREHCRLAKRFEQLVKADPRFEVVADVVLGLVCFRLKAPCAVNKRLLATLNASGTIHMVPASLGDKFTIRFCICAETARDRDVVVAWELIQESAGGVLGLHNFVSWTVKIAQGASMINATANEEISGEDEDEDQELDEKPFELPHVKNNTKALRQSFLVRMVSDPKRYNPKPTPMSPGSPLVDGAKGATRRSND